VHVQKKCCSEFFWQEEHVINWDQTRRHWILKLVSLLYNNDKAFTI